MMDRDRHNVSMGTQRWRAAAAVLATVAGTLAIALPAGAAGNHGTPATLAHSVGVSEAAVARALDSRPVRLLDGGATTLGTRGGEVVVLNFWATWCRPCLKELPALQRLHEEIRPRGGRVLAVSIDADRRNVERFARKHALAIPVAHDGPSGLAQSLDLKAVPLTLVVDRTGTVAWASTRTDEAGLAETRAAVLRLLAAPAAPPALAGDDAEGAR
jgi:thiol-disulfide isomerase/thioredoxin